MSKMKKAETTSAETASTAEQQQLAKARARKSQASPKATEKKPETALTTANPSAVTPIPDNDQTEELKTESVQQHIHVQHGLESAIQLGRQFAFSERRNAEAVFSSFEQTKALIEERLGAAPQVFRQYSGFEPVDLNAVATEQFNKAGLTFSENPDLSALERELLQRPTAPQNSMA